jgi:5-methylcytosine-specific restriction endonuclease McrA
VTVERRALVLNQNYEPLNVCSARRAFVLVHHGKAELVERNDEGIRGVETVFELPSVIRLQYQVRRPRPQVRLTRREIFARDSGRCQYCGHAGGDLTLDHVIPRHRGGHHDWDNLVTACRACNHRKGGRTPAEARMKLMHSPTRPIATPASLFGHYLEGYREWLPFLLGWLDRGTREAFAAS